MKVLSYLDVHDHYAAALAAYEAAESTGLGIVPDELCDNVVYLENHYLAACAVESRCSTVGCHERPSVTGGGMRCAACERRERPGC